MIITKNPITKEGFLRLQKQLMYWKKNDRPKIIDQIRLARSFGDLKENGDYQAAKEQQRIIEKKIHDLETALSCVRIITPEKKPITDTAIFGSIVELQNMRNMSIMVMRIVGTLESNYDQGDISFNSPLGQAILGNRVGCIVQPDIPGDAIKYKIKSIR